MKPYLRYAVSALAASCLLGVTLTTPAMAAPQPESNEPYLLTMTETYVQTWTFFPVKRGQVNEYPRMGTPGSETELEEFSLSNSPSWASVDSTGLVTVQPPADTPKGSYPITVDFKYSDGSQSSFTGNVMVVGTHAESSYVAYPGRYAKLPTPNGPAPLVQPKPVPSALEPTSPAPSNFSLVDAPDWVQVDAATGIMTFTTDGSPTVGAHTFGVALTFPDLSTRTETFTVIVGDFSPALTPFWGDEGENANQLLFLTDLANQPAKVKWEDGHPTLPGTTFEILDGPSWITVDEDGALVGNPPEGSSDAEVAVKVAYPDNTFDTVNVTVLALAANDDPDPVDPIDDGGNNPVDPETDDDNTDGTDTDGSDDTDTTDEPSTGSADSGTPSWVPAVASVGAIFAAILAAIAGFFFL